MDSWTRFAEAIFRVNALLLAAGEQITAPIGQSSARWQVLGQLGYGPKTVAGMARDIGHARQSVQRVADILLAEGLLASAGKPGDRRTALLSLTASGQAALGAIYERQVAWSEQITRQLDDLRLATAVETLQTVATVIETANINGEVR